MSHNTKSKFSPLLNKLLNGIVFLHLALKPPPKNLVRKKDSIWDTIKFVLIALFVTLLIKTFVFEIFKIPSGSMKPNLLIGDYVFVTKFSYGYGPYSIPFAPFSFHNRILYKSPKRGDVAVFRKPTNTSIDFIKRIVGLPGDTIQVINSVLHINGQPVTVKITENFQDYDFRNFYGSVIQYEESFPKLPDNTTHKQTQNNQASDNTHLIIEEMANRGSRDNTYIYKVPANHFFVMGDNRDNSVDSRFTSSVGYIPVENFVGRAETILLSLDQSVRWYEIWLWHKAIRVNRLFKTIQ